MDPISLGLGVIGIGMSIFGGLSQAHIAKEQAQNSMQQIGVEQQENNVRQAAMEASGRRSQLETLRTTQRMRAMSLQAGTTQGANKGSGQAGGLAEVTSEGAYGMQNINNQLGFGRQMFGYDSQLSQLRIQQAQLGGQAATDQGIASLGGAIMKIGGPLGQMTKGLFSGGGIGMFSNGGNDGAPPVWG